MEIEIVYLDQTAALSFSPGEGYVWKPKELIISLITGTGTGSRRLEARHSIGGGPFNDLVDTGPQTGVSSTYTAGMSSVYGTIRYTDYQISSQDTLSILPTLISGDVYSVFIIVEEGPA